MTLPTLSVAHEVRALAQTSSRRCPCCAQPFTAGRHNQRYCDALCKRWYGKRLSRLRRQETVKT